MSDIILGAIILVLAVLAARCYFGKKYGAISGCEDEGCKGCPHAQDCQAKK